MNINKIAIIAALITTAGHCAAGGLTMVSPLVATLDKKIVRVNLDNLSDEKKVFEIEKSDDWMLIAPTHLELEPGKRGVIKVARNIERGPTVVKGQLAVKEIVADGNGRYTVVVLIPAAEKSE